MGVIQDDLAVLEPGNLIHLFELDMTPIDVSAGKLYFHNYPQRSGSAITWQGINYVPLPVEMTVTDVRVSESPPRPKITVSNMDGVLSSLIDAWDDLIGARLIRKTTFEHYLDGESDADDLMELPPELFFIDRKSAENINYVEFELASAMDVQGHRIPSQVVQSTICPWTYRSAECGYVGANVDEDNLMQGQDGGYTGPDVCPRFIASCRARHGRTAPSIPQTPTLLRFGGFPGTQRMQRVR